MESWGTRGRRRGHQRAHDCLCPPQALPPQAAQAHKHERQWTLGHIMNALIDAGLLLERFEEHPEQYWNPFPNLPREIANRLPYTFSLLMRQGTVAAA